MDQVAVMVSPQTARALEIAHEEALDQLDANAMSVCAGSDDAALAVLSPLGE